MACYDGYDAPTEFIDFSRDLVENPIEIDAYFDVDHELSEDMYSNRMHINDSERDLDQDFFTPLKLPQEKESAETCLDQRLRRSLSVGNLPTDKPAINNKSVKEEINCVNNALKNLVISKIGPKRGKSVDRKSNRSSKNNSPRSSRSNSISKFQVDRYGRKQHYASNEELRAKKFVSMAEAVNKFHSRTPQRFRSRSKLDQHTSVVIKAPLFNTVPQSPALRTKLRSRPISAGAISREQKEFQDFEEAQKSRVKAVPLNSKVLEAPVEMPMIKRPLTKLSPFKLTEPLKKKIISSPVFEFHARPVPKSVKEAPKLVVKPSCSQPKIPDLLKQFSSKEIHERKALKIAPVSVPKLGPTKVLPFSFAERDKELQKKKEKLIIEVMEEEKKAREFHAKPMPKTLLKSPLVKPCVPIQRKFNKSNSDLHKSGESINDLNFKARPAKVLQMKPFKPEKSNRPLTEISDFQLNTQCRAAEREEFDKQIKEKQDMIDDAIKQRKLEKIKQEQLEIARIRKETEYKAKPIRQYKEVVPVATKKLTAPISPTFISRKNKENSLP